MVDEIRVKVGWLTEWGRSSEHFTTLIITNLSADHIQTYMRKSPLFKLLETEHEFRNELTVCVPTRRTLWLKFAQCMGTRWL
jgi:hypothetical protein